MADISKCTGEGCPIKEKCYRYTAPTSIWQSYLDIKYEENCDYYWPNIAQKERQNTEQSSESD